MASTIVELQLPTGLTTTLSLYADGSDTLANSGGADTLTEATNRKGLYTATVTEALTGLHYAKILSGANVVASGYVLLQDDTSTYPVQDSKFDAIVSDRTGFILAGVYGAISNAGEATETFAVTDNGNTYTGSNSGLDASGNRSGQTLTKT